MLTEISKSKANVTIVLCEDRGLITPTQAGRVDFGPTQTVAAIEVEDRLSSLTENS